MLFLEPPKVPGEGEIYWGTSLSPEVIGFIIVYKLTPLSELII